MTDYKVKFSSVGTRKDLLNISSNIGNTKSIMGIVKNKAMISVKRAFDNEETPDGEPWLKTKKGRDILKDTYTLYYEMLSPSVYKVMSRKLTLRTFTTDESGFLYGAFHNLTREYANMSYKDLDEVNEEIEDYLLNV